MSLLHSLRVGAQFVRLGFQRRAAYRLANLTGILVNFFFFLIHAQVFLAFFSGRARVAGWSGDEAVLYFATSESLLMVLGVMNAQPARELAERIRSGDVVFDLVRPTRPLLRHVGEMYGDAFYFGVARTPALYLAAAALYSVAPPLELRLLAAPLSIALAVGVAALLSYIAAATAFWWEHAAGQIALVSIATFAFGGIVVPLDFYPDAFRALADVLPFRAAVYTPIATAAGKLAGAELAFGLAHQVVWIGVLTWLARGVERAGARHVALQGG
jgi:ABC-2 type transport system permease protein